MAQINQIEVGEILEISKDRRLVYVGNGKVNLEGAITLTNGLNGKAVTTWTVATADQPLTQPQIDQWVKDKNDAICAEMLDIPTTGRKWIAAQ